MDSSRVNFDLNGITYNNCVSYGVLSIIPYFSNIERAAWLLLLILSLSTALIFVLRAITDFLSHTVSTNMDSLSGSYDNMYFPAITVCNMNFMQR